MIACNHVMTGAADVEVLLVDDDGAVDFALCLTCAAIDDLDILKSRESQFTATCYQCVANLNIPACMPTGGRWQVGSLADA